MIVRLLPAFLLLAAAPALAEQARSVPDTPASFTLSGDQRWVVLTELSDGEAAIGLAREEIGENPSVQVARTKDGKYAVLIGPQAEMPAADLKEKFPEERGAKNVRQSRGEEFVARAWQFRDGRNPAADMKEGKAFALSAGPLALSVRVQRVKKGKDFEFVVITEGRENGKPVFTMRGEDSYSPEPGLKASFVRLEGETPQAVVSQYTGGAHCCMRTAIMTKAGGRKWQTVKAGAIDGDYGPAFEDLDGDGTFEMLSGDNRFLYQFDSYAASRMPAKIEKLVGGKLADVTCDPKYRRYHVQYLAALEAGAGEEKWKESGFLAGWVAQKALLGERAEAIAKARKSFEKGDTPDFEVCMTNKPVETCPEIEKKLIPFAQALEQFLDKSGYK